MSESESIQRRRRELERELSGAIPQFEIVDRDLVVHESLAVDWVGFDEQGALVLVLWSDGRGAEVVLDVLDALAFVRGHLDVLARHWRLDSLDRRPEPPWVDAGLAGRGASSPAGGAAPSATRIRAVCLAEHFDGEARERLSASVGLGLTLFEVRTLRSQMGEGAYLVPVRHHLGEAHDAPVRAAFLDGVPQGQRDLARLFVERMSRVDEQVEALESAGGVAWSHRGRDLGALRVNEERLEAIQPGFAAPVRVFGEEDLDEFVDQALGRLVELGAAVGTAAHSRPNFGDELPEILDDEDLAQVELIPRDSVALLTPEEIAAFHQ